tara:strand:+ start:236 stop:553 length:318 start_codon:yes stop_codon:yes gene_type:complete
MKRFLLFLIFLLFSSTSLFAEYRLEPVNCTIKKKDNCGAYLYNSNTGATYFCNSEKCTEIMPALEEADVSGEVTSSGSKKSKIPKKPKIKKKKSKIPKFKKKKSE